MNSIKNIEKRGIHAMAYFNFIQTANWVELRIKEALSPYKLTHQQFNILRILKGSSPKPLSASAIKERMLFENSDVTRLIDRLVQKKYVERKTCPENRRKVDISINAHGIEVLEEVSQKVLLAINHFFEKQLSVEEAEQLNAILNKMRT